MIYLTEALGRFSLKEPTVSFGLFHFWTFNGANSTGHQKCRHSAEGGDYETSEQFGWPSPSWAEFFVLLCFALLSAIIFVRV